MAGPERGRICGYGRSGPVRDAGAGAVCAGTPVFVKTAAGCVCYRAGAGSGNIRSVGAETDRREESLIEKNRSGTGYLMVAGGADTAK